jgi:hypothetical protein
LLDGLEDGLADELIARLFPLIAVVGSKIGKVELTTSGEPLAATCGLTALSNLKSVETCWPVYLRT